MREHRRTRAMRTRGPGTPYERTSRTSKQKQSALYFIYTGSQFNLFYRVEK